MGKLFATAILAGLAAAAAAQAMPQAEGLLVPVKVEQVTAAAHVTYRDSDHNALVESSAVMVSQAPGFADGGCRMRDTAADASPSAPKGPTSTPHAPARSDDAGTTRPKGRWTACS